MTRAERAADYAKTQQREREVDRQFALQHVDAAALAESRVAAQRRAVRAAERRRYAGDMKAYTRQRGVDKTQHERRQLQSARNYARAWGLKRQNGGGGGAYTGLGEGVTPADVYSNRNMHRSGGTNRDTHTRSVATTGVSDRDEDYDIDGGDNGAPGLVGVRCASLFDGHDFFQVSVSKLNSVNHYLPCLCYLALTFHAFVPLPYQACSIKKNSLTYSSYFFSFPYIFRVESRGRSCKKRVQS
jgi:hypothetical protein